MTTETNDLAMVDANVDLDSLAAQMFDDAEPESATPEPEAEEGVAESDTSEAEETATEADEGDEGDEEEAPKPKKRTTADRLKAKAAENARLAAELAELRAQIESIKNPKPLTDDKPAATDNTGLEKPDPAKYQYGELDPQYLEALADYRADLKIAKFQAQLREQQETERQQEAERRASATLQETATEIERLGSSKFSDFHELVVEGGQNGEYTLTREMFETISELPREVAPDVLYYLASNPDEAAQVAQMSPRRQTLWFGRIEAEITSILKEKSQPTAKKVTSAPPPPASIPKGSGSKSGPLLTDLNDPRALKAMAKALFG